MTTVFTPQEQEGLTEDLVHLAQRQNLLLACEWTSLTLKRPRRAWIVVQRDRTRLCAPFAIYQQRLFSEHWCVALASWRARQANILYRREVGTTEEPVAQRTHSAQAGVKSHASARKE